MSKIKDNVAKLILWLSSYVNVLAFVLVGGYVWLKSENEELKKETKKVFIVALVFVCIDALLALIYEIATLSGSYSGNFYDFYRVINKLVSIAKIVVYAVFAIIAFASKSNKETEKEPVEEVKD